MSKLKTFQQYYDETKLQLKLIKEKNFNCLENLNKNIYENEKYIWRYITFLIITVFIVLNIIVITLLHRTCYKCGLVKNTNQIIPKQNKIETGPKVMKPTSKIKEKIKCNDKKKKKLANPQTELNKNTPKYKGIAKVQNERMNADYIMKNY
ncbi:hypothetical protein A3Q56_03217 [Intoshia linei]|uniref:Uncharacterized protein n=1 Tax=Intoshia linei TaxID=1819745 RepID=A0A177B418_9BILA|nr:hypothetical protein A3Q56_03217 [Intoshia linei]